MKYNSSDIATQAFNISWCSLETDSAIKYIISRLSGEEVVEFCSLSGVPEVVSYEISSLGKIVSSDKLELLESPVQNVIFIERKKIK